MVIVASVRAETPTDPRWSTVQVYAVLIDDQGKQQPNQSETFKKWQAFCQQTSNGALPPDAHGEATLISFKREEDGSPLPDNKADELERVLRWYLRPFS
jgi:hypothetical protein